jgi:flavin reductase (DIM6/NTAB) family NADH-FMN oxidoreductase RutF
MASGAFGLCIPGAGLVDFTYAVGSVSGRDGDKFIRHGMNVTTGPVLGMPLVETGCAAWLECRLISEPHSQDTYDTCFAEVVAAAADARIFAQGHWTVRSDNEALHTIHHLGGGNFARASGAIAAKPL